MRKHKQSWLDIFSGFRVALDARKIILGTLGAYVTIILMLSLLRLAAYWWPEAAERAGDLLRHPFLRSAHVMAAAPCKFCATACRLANPGACCDALKKLAFMTGGGLILLFFWSFFGGAIARIAAVDFAKDERPQIGDAMSFALSKFGSFFWSPLVPLIFVVVLLLCNVLLGVIGRIPVVGPVVMGLFFALAALSAFLVMLLLIGTFFGFLFMWPTIAMEGTDAFDAISRAFNYLYARPWKTIWCWLCAAVYGVAVIGFVALFTCLLLRFAVGSLRLGMGPDFTSIHPFLRAGAPEPGTPLSSVIAMILIRIVIVTAGGLVLGFVASYKITAATIIYSVLRRDVDGTDMSEVFLPEPEETPTEPPAEPAPPEPKPEAPAGEPKSGA